MTLEHWDPARRKWILYQSQQQHSDDCAAYPFEKLPTRIFLDTNIINILVKFRDHVFEQVPIPDSFSNTATALDAEALMHLFYVGSRASWDIMASTKTIEEISQTKNFEIRGSLLDYALQVVDLRSEDSVFAENFGRSLADSHFVSALPDRADRELVGNAIALRCDVFCTSDRNTIVNKRGHLSPLPIRILTPIEWWAHVKPWAGLWG